MKTYFASPERVSDAELRKEVSSVSNNPVVDGIMRAAGGMLAVLDEHRQIIALNHSLLSFLGTHDIHGVLGLRLGEAVHCVHAHDMPGGCGTGEYCKTCGAAIAIVSSMEQNRPVERLCALSTEDHGGKRDFCFRVRSCPITFQGHRLLLLYLQDVTREQQWASLEKIFFHDVNNVTAGIVGISDLLADTPGGANPELLNNIRELALHLAGEVAFQRTLKEGGKHVYHPVCLPVMVSHVWDDLRAFFSNHPAAKGKRLLFTKPASDLSVTTDLVLLERILGNMIVNALEASDPGMDVRIWCEQTDTDVVFHVRNRRAISADVQKRVFQRYFSTKPEMGRGLGTYSMKLFGEEFLGGKVSFTSSGREGTTFHFSFPA